MLHIYTYVPNELLHIFGLLLCYFNCKNLCQCKFGSNKKEYVDCVSNLCNNIKKKIHNG